MVDRNASRKLIEFVQTFSDLQEKHLDAIHSTMRETVDGVMAGIQEISKIFIGVPRPSGESATCNLDSELENLLLSMMGQLSRDDIIKQRIDHVRMSMQALQSQLTYILADYEKRCGETEVNNLINDSKAFALRIYTMEEERRLHFSVFHEDLNMSGKVS
jgi:hypothetical protein